MPTIACPVTGCTYTTEDVDANLAVTLLSLHAVDLNSPIAAAKVEKVKRPTVSSAGTSEDWAYFQSRWLDYTEATKVTGKDKVVQLLECCDEQLRKDLTRNASGSLTNKAEIEVLAAIKKLAVREENTMVARVQLHNMRQDRDETIRSFGARLRGQAGVCKFLVKCPGCDADVKYTEAIPRDVLTLGIADTEIQLDLLGDKNQDMTLEDISLFVEAKEAGKLSASRLLVSQGAEATHSSTYRRDKRAALTSGADNEHKASETCAYCAKKGRGRSAPLPSGGNHVQPTTTLASTATGGTTSTMYAATRTRPKSSQETSPHLASVKEPYLMPSVLSPHPTTSTEAREAYHWTTTSTTNCVMCGRSEHRTPNLLSMSQSGCCQKTS